MEIVTCRLLLSHIPSVAKLFKLLYLNHACLTPLIKQFQGWIVQVERRSGGQFLALCPAGWGKSNEDLLKLVRLVSTAVQFVGYWRSHQSDYRSGPVS